MPLEQRSDYKMRSVADYYTAGGTGSQTLFADFVVDSSYALA
jgi:hypothetical protein